MSSFKKYKFLIKPAFYIFSLLFSCWFVLKIEKVSPSNFGRYRSLFENDSKSKINAAKIKPQRFRPYLQKLFTAYKTGHIDSTRFEQQFDKFLKAYKDFYEQEQKKPEY